MQGSTILCRASLCRNALFQYIWVPAIRPTVARSGPCHILFLGHSQSFQPPNTWFDHGTQVLTQASNHARQAPYSILQMHRPRPFELRNSHVALSAQAPPIALDFASSAGPGGALAGGPNPTWLCGQWLAAARVAARRGGPRQPRTRWAAPWLRAGAPGRRAGACRRRRRLTPLPADRDPRPLALPPPPPSPPAASTSAASHVTASPVFRRACPPPLRRCCSCAHLPAFLPPAVGARIGLFPFDLFCFLPATPSPPFFGVAFSHRRPCTSS